MAYSRRLSCYPFHIAARMVNLQDPAVVAKYGSISDKVWHAMTGLFVWELIVTLDYEWSVFRGHRPYRWTIWIYFTTRVATLLAMICLILDFDASIPSGCQVFVTFHLFLSNLAWATASLLIVLRIIAIWNRDKVIVATSIGVWLVNLSFLIQGVVRPRSAWDPVQGGCATLNILTTKPTMISVFVTDFILLLIMLIGLIRLRLHGGTLLGLGRLLWKQGIIWLLLATVAEVPPALFIILDLNEPLDVMFMIPSLITMAIASTRMYRTLTDFTCRPIELALDSPQGSGPSIPKFVQTPTTKNTLNQTEITVHTAYVQYPRPQTSDRSVDTGSEREESYKQSGLIAGEDLERGVEN
ncbi:hypothetical protein BJV74DRAFT_277454 [Russula compacta]|nr:hypothetical protein BJV74DRAFT_277454 [Russula compacta]